MAKTDIRVLIERLNPTLKSALEKAAATAMSRSHYTVKMEHWLLTLLELGECDIVHALVHFTIPAELVIEDINKSLELCKTGNEHAPALDNYLIELLEKASMHTSLDFSYDSIRSGVLLYSYLKDSSLEALANNISTQLETIESEQLKDHFEKIVVDSPESTSSTNTKASSKKSSSNALDQYTIDLVDQARQGKLDPVIGRDLEIRQMIDILTRRRQNNPILTGEAGVGKTAVVEGLALRIHEGDVPESLLNVTLKTLDMGLLQAGAGVKGEFENRLKDVINEVSESVKPIIIFIDEAHTIIGAGGQAGMGDAANLLKPALARGELRTIAATTWAEYKKYFEKDAALSRRFQVVKIDEPTEQVSLDIIRGLAPVMSKHHGVQIHDNALIDAVKLSKRYIPARQLPDKAISVLDTACARVALSRASESADIEAQRRKIESFTREIESLERSFVMSEEAKKRKKVIETDRKKAQTTLNKMEKKWLEEKSITDDLIEITEHQKMTNEETPEQKDTELNIARYLKKKKKLNDLQGESPKVYEYVDSNVIADIIADWTGIPVGNMKSGEVKNVLDLSSNMQKRVIGQDYALNRIAQVMQTSSAKLTNPKRPIGVFLFAGPSGVGKTETALTLAEQMYGSESNITTINMSEFKEEHKVSLLMGPPPGYVGYGEGGVLTEAVRRKPYSVILLDEIEKAHPGVQDIFYQVFDKGILRDGEGRDIDFKNTVIIMTSNVASDTISQLFEDPATAPEHEGLLKAIKPDLLDVFKPAFLGRTEIIPYIPLNEDVIKSIIDLQLNIVKERVENNYQASFSYTRKVVDNIIERCSENDTGARNVHKIIYNNLLPQLSKFFLESMISNESIQKIKADINSEGDFTFKVDKKAIKNLQKAI